MDHPIVGRALVHIGSRELVSNFFFVFSRFEFALKRFAKFAEEEPDGDAQARWSKFADEPTIVNAFNGKLSETLLQSIDYLVAHPPKKQVFKDRRLDWCPVAPQGAARGPKNVLLMILRVRNNLFHGSKLQGGPEAEPARDERLITAALAVLDHALTHSPAEIQVAFDVADG